MMENGHRATNGISQRLKEVTLTHHSEENTIGEKNDLIKIGNRSIPTKLVEEVILNASVILKQGFLAEIPEDQTHHHGSVCVTSKGEKVEIQLPQDESFKNGRWGACDIFQKTLCEIVNDGVICSCEFLISISRKLGDAVKLMHDRGKTHGNLAPEFVVLCRDNKNHPLIRESSSSAATKSDDIEALGKLFYFVMTNGTNYLGEVKSEDLFKTETAGTSREPAETAKNLIEKMIQKQMAIGQVLQHPLFWEEKRKINFIADLFESISNDEDAIKDLEEEASKSVFGGNWIEKLTLYSSEKEKAKEECGIATPTFDIFQNKTKPGKASKARWYVSTHLRDGEKLVKIKPMNFERFKKLTGQSISTDSRLNEVASNTSQDRTGEWRVVNAVVEAKMETLYRAGSFYDLLRFYRNNKAHYWESLPLERKYYKAAGGFWTFYSKRYPKLLSFLYDHVDKFPGFVG